MFLPRILAALLLLLVVGLLLNSSPTRPAVVTSGSEAAAVADGQPQVVAGSGQPGPAILAQVAVLVREQMAALRTALPVAAPKKFFVFVHANRAELPEAIAAHLHEDSPAFALLGRHQIHLVWGEMARLGSSARAVVTHELVHELLDQIVAPQGGSLPRWFHEGLAQHLAGDSYLGAREEDLVWRVAVSRLLPFGELSRGFPSDRESIRTAYAQSLSFVAWLVRELGYDSVLRTVTNVDGLTSFERALVGTARRSTEQLQADWRDYLLHVSGAPWRVFMEQWWGFLGIALLPVLVLALRQRLAAGQRAAARLAQVEHEQQLAAQAARDVAMQLDQSSPTLEVFGPPLPEELRESLQDDRAAGRDW